MNEDERPPSREDRGIVGSGSEGGKEPRRLFERGQVRDNLQKLFENAEWQGNDSVVDLLSSAVFETHKEIEDDSKFFPDVKKIVTGEVPESKRASRGFFERLVGEHFEGITSTLEQEEFSDLKNALGKPEEETFVDTLKSHIQTAHEKWVVDQGAPEIQEKEPPDRSKVFQEALEEIGVEKDRAGFVGGVLAKALELSSSDDELFQKAEGIFGELEAFLKKKREGFQEEEEEEVSIFELLMLMLKFLWKQVKEALGEVYESIQEDGETVSVEDGSFPQDLRFEMLSEKTDEEGFGGVFSEFFNLKIGQVPKDVWGRFRGRVKDLGGEDPGEQTTKGEVGDVERGDFQEVRKKLEERGAAPEMIERAVDRRRKLQEIGLEGPQGGAPDDGEEIEFEPFDEMDPEDIDEMLIKAIDYYPRALEYQKLLEKAQQGDLAKLLSDILLKFRDVDLKKTLFDRYISEQNKQKPNPNVIRNLQREIYEAYKPLRLFYEKNVYVDRDGDEYERQLSLYGPKASEMMGRVSDTKNFGVFKLLARDFDREGFSLDDVKEEVGKIRSEIKKKIELLEKKGEKPERVELYRKHFLKSLDDWEGDIGNHSEEENLKILQYDLFHGFAKRLFENIIGDAEENPREGFKMPPWGQIVLGELQDMIREAGLKGPNYRQGLISLLQTRHSHFALRGVVGMGGDIKTMLEQASRFQLAHDFDVLMRLEPGLGAAVRNHENVLKSLRADPTLGGRIPSDYFINDPDREFKPPIIQERIRDVLLLQSEEGALLDEFGREIKLDENEALRMAGLAMSYSDGGSMRTIEHASQMPLKRRGRGGSGHQVSEYADIARFDDVRLGSQRFETYAFGREAILPIVKKMEQAVQPGVYEKPKKKKKKWFGLRGEKDVFATGFDAFGIDPENIFNIGGTYSISSWRSQESTEKQRRHGLALGIELFSEKLNSQKRINIFKAVGERIPTVIAFYWPAIALEETETDGQYLDFKGRLRKDVVADGEQRNQFIKYIERKAEKILVSEDERILEHIGDEIVKDVKSRVFRTTKFRALFRGKSTISKNSELVEGQIDKAIKDYRDQPEGNREIRLGGELGEVLRERVEERKRILELQHGARASFLLTIQEADSPGFDPSATENSGWEKEAWERWEKLETKILVLQQKKIAEFVRDKYGKKDDQDDWLQADWKILDSITPGENGFTEADRAIVERLTNLGAESSVGAKKGAERLASVDFSYTPFLDDVVHEKEEWKEGGPRVQARRLIDIAQMKEAAQKFAMIASGKVIGEDRAPRHRAELVQSIAEAQETMQYSSLPDRQKIAAAYTYEILQNMYRADGWINIPIAGPLADWGGPFGLWKKVARSSLAQRKFGTRALSMTALERYNFIEDLRPWVGNEQADKLQEMTNSKFGNAIGEVILQWLLVGIPLYVAITMANEARKRLVEAGKAELQTVAQGR